LGKLNNLFFLKIDALFFVFLEKILTMKRKVNAVWSGDGADGTGVLNSQSGALNNVPYSFKSRFKNDDGTLGTNPEELIAAALAGCFNMKLSFVLNDAGFNPKSLKTDAVLTFEEGVVTNIALSLKGKVAGIAPEKFEALANEAKDNCPVSAVLNCNISLESSLR
jgi:osmotically inducible protein OsmC